MVHNQRRGFWHGWRRDAHPAEPDPADLGTAIGLEMSLDQDVYSPPPQRPAPAPARRGGWKRLFGRRESA